MIYSFLYVIIYSCASVFIEKLYFSIPPLFSLMITASIATLYFNLVNIGKLKPIYLACWHEKKMWLAIMISVLVMWCCTMTGPGLIGASLNNFMYFGWLGVLGFISLGLQKEKKSRSKLYFGLMIVGLMAIAIFDTVNHGLTKGNILGLLIGIIGGTASFIYLKQSQILLSKIKLSATQILAIRFYLTIIVLFFVIPKDSFSLYLTWKSMGELIILAFMSLIIPLFFMQKALEKITSEQNAIIMSLSPVVTAFIQELLFNNVEFKFIVVYLLYFSIILASYFVNKYKTVRIIV